MFHQLFVFDQLKNSEQVVTLWNMPYLQHLFFPKRKLQKNAFIIKNFN